MNDRDFNKKYGFKNLHSFLLKNPHIKKIATKPKARYIYPLGSKKEIAEMMEMLKHKIKPYPKRTKQ